MPPPPRRFVSIKAISLISLSTMLKVMAAAPSEKALEMVLAHTRDSHHQTRRGAVEVRSRTDLPPIRPLPALLGLRDPLLSSP